VKRVIVSAIGAIALVVGAYHVARLTGTEAVVVTASFVFGIAGIAYCAPTIAPFAFAAFAAAIAFLLTDFTASPLGIVAIAIAFTIAFVAIALSFAGNIRQNIAPRRWAFAVYLIEGAAILGALTVNDGSRSATIATIGVLGLLALWRLAPESSPPEERAHLEQPPAAAPSKRNGT